MERPTRITVFGVLCLIVGGFGCMSNLQGIHMAAVGASALDVPELGNSAGQIEKMYQETLLANQAALGKPVYRALLGVESVASAAMAVWLVIAGFALLREREQALWMTRVWAYFALFAAAGTVVLNMQFVMPETVSHTRGSAITGAILMLLVGWAFPVVLLTVLPRPIVTDYLRRVAERTGGGAIGHATGFAKKPGSRPKQRSAPPGGQGPAESSWRDDPWNDPGSQ